MELTLEEVFKMLEKENWFTDEEMNYLKENATQVDSDLNSYTILGERRVYLDVDLANEDNIRLCNFYIYLSDKSLEFRDDYFW